VVEYRAYSVDHDGNFVGFEALVCADDAEAIEKVNRLADRYAIELWSGDRFVTRLEAKTK
jgi:predicted dinucleotide-binding enzyme